MQMLYFSYIWYTLHHIYAISLFFKWEYDSLLIFYSSNKKSLKKYFNSLLNFYRLLLFFDGTELFSHTIYTFKNVIMLYKTYWKVFTVEDYGLNSYFTNKKLNCNSCIAMFRLFLNCSKLLNRWLQFIQ